mmetsp:Transcript_40129/g.66598  ORF Transcript_40129/g.66598 Transcript_40129/m.66598 type:complete len:277 (-) Transcript_40129:239-1069(-)|eukprot:CAMPEP_0119346306 /NCGR_PEP_ID=MMETSP1333-20130426/107936_1 /TAXON_ID=418940 /ORGANISM="Scyphosphaera apsteinii, Strain RCC1455" /LENGTH=276 /DNA_ID=CAMNT_0007358805 /DNA_START=37 /DNA_END=867 /DNA_ORIENTATION=-
MPVCSRCFEVKELDDFSDAQLLTKGRCLQCSNPKLAARKSAAGLDHYPLSDLGRTPQTFADAMATRKSSSRTSRTCISDATGTRECSCCNKQLPFSSYSTRQLSGKGKCKVCAAQSCLANQQVQQAISTKRKHEDIISTLDPGDAAHRRELLSRVDEARKLYQRELCAPTLDKQNTGHRMLERLGWLPGTGLGAQRDGAICPAALEMPSQCDKRGIGCAIPCAESSSWSIDDSIAEYEGALSLAGNPGEARAMGANELVWSAVDEGSLCTDPHATE